MLYKKSQIRRIALLIIGALFIVVMLSFIFNNILHAAESSAWKTECSTSVQSNVRWRQISDAFAEDIRCPTLDISVDEKSAAKKIRQLTIDCWDIYGQGKLDLFTDENTYCGICAIFDFENRDKEIRLIGKEFDYTSSISSNNIYSTIFIYAKGEQEIQELIKMLDREKTSGKISAYIGPYRGTEWYAASLVGEYTREGLDKIGCKAIPIKQ
ncbi:hypothetical protein KY343_00685 [Candidatus Woesearchaeota archaeon]|nr:hypothetical protein [Candidatus Woesearchaeota archaeon]